MQTRINYTSHPLDCQSLPCSSPPFRPRSKATRWNGVFRVEYHAVTARLDRLIAPGRQMFCGNRARDIRHSRRRRPAAAVVLQSVRRHALITTLVEEDQGNAGFLNVDRHEGILVQLEMAPQGGVHSQPNLLGTMRDRNEVRAGELLAGSQEHARYLAPERRWYQYNPYPLEEPATPTPRHLGRPVRGGASGW